MIRRLPTLLALAVTLAPLAAPAQAIWKWRDANGTLQVSDQQPPSSVPEKSILSRPGGRGETVVSVVDEAAAASAPAATPSRRDAALDGRKRELQAANQAAEAARQAEARQRDQARKDDNCRRSRAHLATLDSGARVARTNDKGEREVLDDSARAAETARARQQVQANCN